MVIDGRKEQEIFESHRSDFPETVLKAYDGTKAYHDGRWIMIDVADPSLMPTIEKMMVIKKKPRPAAKE